jgi:hypothetical protein
VRGFPENHPPPVQVSNDAKVANNGPHRKISTMAVAAVMSDNNSKKVEGESLADCATIQMQDSQQMRGNRI